MLSTCKKQDVIESISAVIKNDPGRRKLSVQVVGHSDGDIEEESTSETNNDPLLQADGDFDLDYVIPNDPVTSANYISDIIAFKNTLESFPNVLFSK